MSEERISEIEIKLIKDQLTLAGHLLKDLDLQGYLRELDRADSFGPFFDPTGWMRTQRERANAESLVRSAIPFQQAFLHLQEKALKALQE